MKKQTEKDKLTALYERLSHHDKRAGESVSIENQKRIFGGLRKKERFYQYPAFYGYVKPHFDTIRSKQICEKRLK